MPKSGLRIYGELLIDDINFHKENAFFLNKYAYLLGFQKTSFPLNSSNIWFEYSNVLNQVCQSFHLLTFTHTGFSNWALSETIFKITDFIIPKYLNLKSVKRS